MKLSVGEHQLQGFYHFPGFVESVSFLILVHTEALPILKVGESSKRLDILGLFRMNNVLPASL